MLGLSREADQSLLAAEISSSLIRSKSSRSSLAERDWTEEWREGSGLSRTMMGLVPGGWTITGQLDMGRGGGWIEER